MDLLLDSIEWCSLDPQNQTRSIGDNLDFPNPSPIFTYRLSFSKCPGPWRITEAQEEAAQQTVAMQPVRQTWI